MDGLGNRSGIEQLDDLAFLVGIDPPHDVAHLEATERRRANSSGANILVAVAYQKSPSVIDPTDVFATRSGHRRLGGHRARSGMQAAEDHRGEIQSS